jgi:sigma-54 dependent transcriptional regulator, acetoin dehydrogenase operon transcriptional activator AcoR
MAPDHDITTLVRTTERENPGGASNAHSYLFLSLRSDRPLDPPACLRMTGLDEVIIGRGQPSLPDGVKVHARRLEVRVPDSWMSSTHLRLIKLDGRWVMIDEDSTNGTLLNGVPKDKAVLADGDLLELGHTFFFYRELVSTTVSVGPGRGETSAPAGAAEPVLGLDTLIPSLAERFATLAQIAASSLSVVLQGESGTGKEVVAQAVHRLSGRSGPFVAVNCGALPESLIETELFGYRKGAFSGAGEDRPGLVRSADRGTLFLDEIGDLPASSQAAFLRVLQESEVVAVGATRPVKVDVRIVAATHRDLPSLVGRGEFRRDLFARLAGYTLELPPLRARREDLGILIASLLRKLPQARASELTFSSDAARALLRYDWPLNIRELEKWLTMASLLAKSGRIELNHLPQPAPLPALGGDARAPAGPALDAGPSKADALSAEDAARRVELLALFHEHGGNISAVARAMGKGRTQIQRWIQRYGILVDEFKK